MLIMNGKTSEDCCFARAGEGETKTTKEAVASRMKSILLASSLDGW